ncbi:hypothetical protein FUAX_20480 [Fulvitalea axinellae]|uniref:Sigma-70 family RNA polymerase sigma factor n=1 Tax=Fulvitalea axinellae TaxID=1182444 RepID=A0AAU9CKW0_9BACT|nr:hypothetical protein FUAX_20480 [Fulvitalea axinellae]
MNDQETLKRLRAGDEGVLADLYKKHFHKITSMITRQGGGMEEAQDVFQEALVAFWQNSRKEDFKLTAQIGTYLYSVCRNLWTKELSRRQRFSTEEADKPIESDYDRDERVRIIRECVGKMSETCKKVLTLFYFDGLRMERIASELGYSSTDAVKTQKYKCKKKLDAYIKSRFGAEDFQDL